MSISQPRAVPLPPESGIAAAYAHVNLVDAFAIDLPPGTARNPEVLTRFIFSHQPRWTIQLMRIRDALVAAIGLKTVRKLRAAEAASSRISIFKVYESNSAEVVMGEDDKHLDFRISALYQAPFQSSGRPRLVLSTVVHCHNRLGRVYLGLIAPFHRLVVQACLRRAARIGWPRENEVQSPGSPVFGEGAQKPSVGTGNTRHG